jgi:hypothetical protein
LLFPLHIDSSVRRSRRTVRNNPMHVDAWRRVYDAFPNSELGPEASQRKLDRIARKCIIAAIGHSPLETYSPTTCDVTEQVITREDLNRLLRFHDRAEHKGKTTPMVVVELEGQRIVVEGNSRVNAWVKGTEPASRVALVISPKVANPP